MTPENTVLLALALHNEGVRQANMGHNHRHSCTWNVRTNTTRPTAPGRS